MLLSLFIALIALIGNAYFVGVEFGIVSARRSAIEPLASSGSRAAKKVLSAMNNLPDMLAMVQFGITLCSLIFGATGETLLSPVFEYIFEIMHISTSLALPMALFVSIFMMIYVHVVIGEIIPKNLAMISPTKIALTLIPPMLTLTRIFRPIINIINKVSLATLKLLGVKAKTESGDSFTRDEVAIIVEESSKNGLITGNELQLLNGSLMLSDIKIKSVMTAINAITATWISATPRDIEKLSLESGFSRFPVYNNKGVLSNYIHIKDILSVSEDNYDKPVSKTVLRPLYSINDGSSLREALTLMQQVKSHILKVIDNNKNVIGTVTMEDIVNGLIGKN